MSKKVFVDTDIVLDLLIKRPPFYSSAAMLFGLAEEKKIELYISPVLVSNIYYILRKYNGQEAAILNIRKLRMLVNIAPVSQGIIDLVLASKFKDFEDGIQYYCAVEAGIKTLLTRNVKDFVGKEIRVMSCDEYLASLKVNKG
jgi:predicted nucleic acid-binding protein